jgi:hypothetical protein
VGHLGASFVLPALSGRGRGRQRALALLVVLVALAAPAVVLVAPAAALADTVTVTASPLTTLVEGTSFSRQVATFTDSGNDTNANHYTAAVQWGDGTSSVGSVTFPSGGTTGTVTASHTYVEEGTYDVMITVQNTAGPSPLATASTFPTVADAPLGVPAGTPVELTGAGSTQTAAAMSAFEGAIGGADNGTTPGEQSGGWRHITWDNIKLDGSDPGSTTIVPNAVVAIAPDREQPYGIDLQHGDAVAGDGFASVNSSVAGKLAPFSSPNVFAPFNSNVVRMQVVAPASQGSAPVPAATRGLGAVFLNVHSAGTTIQYFNGNAPLGAPMAVPISGQGQQSFAGELFSSPVVTNVVITLGSDAIFEFDGTSSTPSAVDGSLNNQDNPTDLVAADDVVLAEPVSAQTTVQATAGVPFSGTIDTFFDSNPGGSASDFTALINWGDGTQTTGTVTSAGSSSNGPVFNVTGTHDYAKQGTFSATVSVSDWGGSTQSSRLSFQVAPRFTAIGVSCSPSPVAVTTPAACTATATDISPGVPIVPTGSLMFSSSAGGGFGKDTGCQLQSDGRPGQAACAVLYAPTALPKRPTQIFVTYAGDAAHAAANGAGRLAVVAQTCTVKLPSRRLGKRHALKVAVTCDEHASARLTIGASVARNGSHAGSRFSFASVQRTFYAGRRTLSIRPSRATAARLLAAAHADQRISLRASITATGITRTTTATATLRTLRGV